MEGNYMIRSRHAHHKSFLRFANKTERIIDILWIDYKGKFVHYIKLDPGLTVAVDTYSTHAWIFVDSLTGERMRAEHSDKQNIYWAEPFFVINVMPENKRVLKRKQVNIHFPLRTLRETAMWSIVKKLIVKEQIDCLEIPNCLRDEMQSIFNQVSQHKQRKSVNLL